MEDIIEWIKHIHIFHYLNINYKKLPIDNNKLNKIIRYLLKSFHPDNLKINNPSDDILIYFDNYDIQNYKNKLIKNDKLFDFLNFIKNNLNFLIKPIKNNKLNENFKLKYLLNNDDFINLKNNQNEDKSYKISKNDEITFNNIIDKIITKDEITNKIKNYNEQSNIIKNDILKDDKKELLIKNFNKTFEDNIENEITEIINYKPISYNLIKNNYYDINNQNDIKIDEYFKINKLKKELNNYNKLIKNNNIEQLINVRENEL